MRNANLMQLGNCIDLFLARHVSATYAHHQEHYMLNRGIWFSASSFWIGGGLESRCVGRVYGADGARHHPHRTHDLRSGSQDHHPSKNSVQKTICCNSTYNAPDDGRMYPIKCRAKNTSIKLPSCIKLAFHIISWGRCTVKQPSIFFIIFTFTGCGQDVQMKENTMGKLCSAQWRW